MIGAPHHFAYVVDDIEATAEGLNAQFGAGPFFLAEDVPLENAQSGGEPAEFAHDSAFGMCGESAFELITPARLAPAAVEAGFGDPRPRLQHVGYVFSPDSVGDVRRQLDERGAAQYLSSQMGELDSTLHDARALLGHDLEIHADCEPLNQFFGMVREAAQGWDGSDVLRPAPG